MFLDGDHPRFESQVLYCQVCPAGAKAQKDHALQEANNAWLNSGIPTRFRAFTLATSPWATRIPSTIEALKESGSSWFFWGPVGSGKTGLAIGYAREWVEAEVYGILFRPVPDLLSDLRDTYNRRDGSRSEGDVLNECRDADLLILDDLGAEHVKDSGWLEDRLYQIIGHRHADDSATVFTSNLSLQQLAGRIGERNIWRIAEMCEGRVVHLDGPNQRNPKERVGG